MNFPLLSFPGLVVIVETIIQWLAKIALVVAPPLLRIALAVPFFKSGLTKWSGFLTLSPAAQFLFEDEFKLHIFGQAYNFPSRTRSPSLTASPRSCFPSSWRSDLQPGSARSVS